jgi:hypothetical protein
MVKGSVIECIVDERNDSLSKPEEKKNFRTDAVAVLS